MSQWQSVHSLPSCTYYGTYVPCSPYTHPEYRAYSSWHNVLLASAESGNVAATAFDDDLVRCVDDENATVVHGNSTGNASGLAC